MMLPLLALMLAIGSPDCENTANQGEINACALIGYREADAELNRQWAVTLAAVRKRNGDVPAPVGGAPEQRLRDAQRAWITYRDAHCDSFLPYGSTAQLDYAQNIWCHTELTQARTEQLKEIAATP